MNESIRTRRHQPAAATPDRRHEHAPVLTGDAAQLHPRRGPLCNVPRALTPYRHDGSGRAADFACRGPIRVYEIPIRAVHSRVRVGGRNLLDHSGEVPGGQLQIFRCPLPEPGRHGQQSRHAQRTLGPQARRNKPGRRPGRLRQRTKPLDTHPGFALSRNTAKLSQIGPRSAHHRHSDHNETRRADLLPHRG